MPEANNQDQDNAHLEGEHVNEFELTEEEKAELAALDAQNDDSEELTDVNSESKLFDDIHIDDEDVNNRGGAAGQQEEKTENDNPDNNNPELGAGGGDNGATGAGNNAGSGDGAENNNNDDIEPPKDYSAEIEELDQQKQEADGKIQDTLDQLKELSTKFDDGEIGQGQYDFDRLKLQRELNKLEVNAQRIESKQETIQQQAETEIQAYQQKSQQGWFNNLRAFVDLPENELIKNNPNVANKFDQILNGLNEAGLLDGLSHSQVLSTVRTNLAIHFPALNSAVPAQPKEQNQGNKPPKPTHDKANIPLSLANQQTLEIPDQTDPFAYIRKLDGIEYEKAIEKLSEEQLNQFYQ